jgi:hypothetical protein
MDLDGESASLRLLESENLGMFILIFYGVCTITFPQFIVSLREGLSDHYHRRKPEFSTTLKNPMLVGWITVKQINEIIVA